VAVTNGFNAAAMGQVDVRKAGRGSVFVASLRRKAEDTGSRNG
jgi:hypothetical protein